MTDLAELQDEQITQVMQDLGFEWESTYGHWAARLSDARPRRIIDADEAIALVRAIQDQVAAAGHWGVKYAISQFCKMNIENPKAPVNIDEVKRRAMLDVDRRFGQ